MKNKILILITIAILAACISPARNAVQSPVEIENNLTYYCDKDCELCLDIAYPTDTSVSHPAVIYIFDSAWGYHNTSHRSLFHNIIRNAAETGYVAVAVDYRPVCVKNGGESQDHYSEQIEDSKKAVTWLKNNSDKYSIDTDNIVVVGYGYGEI